MRSPWWSGGRALAAVLVDPAEATAGALARPRPGGLFAWFGGAALALGLGTLPRQLALLRRALPPVGDAGLDAQQEALREGLRQLIVADRLVPAPALLVAAVVLVLAAEPVLMLARDRRAAIWAVAALGLAPVLVDRLGELAMTYVAAPDGWLSAGEVLLLPHRFVTGPLLAWHGEGTPPAWLTLLEPRANLLVLWSAAIWVVGLRALDGEGLAAWHVALPVVGLGAGGVVTWVVGPLVIPLLLGV